MVMLSALLLPPASAIKKGIVFLRSDSRKPYFKAEREASKITDTLRLWDITHC